LHFLDLGLGLGFRLWFAFSIRDWFSSPFHLPETRSTT
jgi:hypothetical protein